MKPLATDSIVTFRGHIYFVQEVLRDGDDPLYLLRSTATPQYAKYYTVALHSEVTRTVRLSGEPGDQAYVQLPLRKDNSS